MEDHVWEAWRNTVQGGYPSRIGWISVKQVLGQLRWLSRNFQRWGWISGTYEEDKNTEIFKRKVATIALNTLQQLFWPHLCGEDPWTVQSQPPPFTKSQRRCLMGHVLEWRFRWLTSVWLRWFKRKLYNVKAPHKMEIEKYSERREKKNYCSTKGCISF